MKRCTPILLLLIFFSSTSVPGQILKRLLKHEVTFEYLEGCELGNRECPPLILERRVPQQSVFLIFPSGGTHSAVSLYAAADLTTGCSPQITPLRSDACLGNRSPVLELTGLADGRYFAQMISCALGGRFTVELRTQYRNETRD